MSRREFTRPTMRLALERAEGLCEGILSTGHRCNANLKHKPHHFDHIIPDAIGGDNSLTNCQVLCVPCHDEKTFKIDIPVIAKSKRVSDKHNGIKLSRPKMRGQGFRKAPAQRSASRPIIRKSETGSFRQRELPHE